MRRLLQFVWSKHYEPNGSMPFDCHFPSQALYRRYQFRFTGQPTAIALWLLLVEILFCGTAKQNQIKALSYFPTANIMNKFISKNEKL